MRYLKNRFCRRPIRVCGVVPSNNPHSVGAMLSSSEKTLPFALLTMIILQTNISMAQKSIKSTRLPIIILPIFFINNLSVPCSNLLHKFTSLQPNFQRNFHFFLHGTCPHMGSQSPFPAFMWSHLRSKFQSCAFSLKGCPASFQCTGCMCFTMAIFSSSVS